MSEVIIRRDRLNSDEKKALRRITAFRDSEDLGISYNSALRIAEIVAQADAYNKQLSVLIDEPDTAKQKEIKAELEMLDNEKVELMRQAPSSTNLSEANKVMDAQWKARLEKVLAALAEKNKSEAIHLTEDFMNKVPDDTLLYCFISSFLFAIKGEWKRVADDDPKLAQRCAEVWLARVPCMSEDEYKDYGHPIPGHQSTKGISHCIADLQKGIESASGRQDYSEKKDLLKALHKVRRDSGIDGIEAKAASTEPEKNRSLAQQRQVGLIEKVRELMQHELDTTWPEGKIGLKAHVIRNHVSVLRMIYGKVAVSALARKTQPSECKKLGIPALPK